MRFPEWLKTRIFTFGIAFHLFIAGNRRHFKFGMGVKHSKSQPTDDKPSMKWAWSRLGCTRDDIFSHFDKTSTCDRRADGHRAIAYTALAKRRAGTSRKAVRVAAFTNLAHSLPDTCCRRHLADKCIVR